MPYQNRIKEFRKERKMSQAELAKKSGISRTTISSLEVGRAEVVKTNTLVAIADALNVDVGECFFVQKV